METSMDILRPQMVCTALACATRTLSKPSTSFPGLSPSTKRQGNGNKLTYVHHLRRTELNNALRMFVTSLLSSSLVPRAAILTVSATDPSSGLWNVNELLNVSFFC